MTVIRFARFLDSHNRRTIATCAMPCDLSQHLNNARSSELQLAMLIWRPLYNFSFGTHACENAAPRAVGSP